jgi:hypothetical protein
MDWPARIAIRAVRALQQCSRALALISRLSSRYQCTWIGPATDKGFPLTVPPSAVAAFNGASFQPPAEPELLEQLLLPSASAEM